MTSSISSMASAAARAVWGTSDPNSSPVQATDPAHSAVDRTFTSSDPAGTSAAADTGDSNFLVHQHGGAPASGLAAEHDSTATAPGSQPTLGHDQSPSADTGLATRPADTTASLASTTSITTAHDLPPSTTATDFGTRQAQSAPGRDLAAVPLAGHHDQVALHPSNGEDRPVSQFSADNRSFLPSETPLTSHQPSRNAISPVPSMAATHDFTTQSSTTSDANTAHTPTPSAATPSSTQPAAGNASAIDAPRGHHSLAAPSTTSSTKPATKDTSNTDTDSTSTNPAGASSAPAPDRKDADEEQDAEPNPDIPAPRSLIEVAREHGGDAGMVGKDGKDRSAGKAGQSTDNERDVAEAAKQTEPPVEVVHATGLRADGGDFDATKPGAAKEANRLLAEKGIHIGAVKYESDHGTDVGDDGVVSGDAEAGSGKPSLGQRIKAKLHKH